MVQPVNLLQDAVAGSAQLGPTFRGSEGENLRHPGGGDGEGDNGVGGVQAVWVRVVWNSQLMEDITKYYDNQPLQLGQKTSSQVSQYASSWSGWLLHRDTSSLFCFPISSSSWFTRKAGGMAETPRVGIKILSRHIGQLRYLSSKFSSFEIFCRHSRHTV